MSTERSNYNVVEHLGMSVERRVEEADCRLAGLKASFIDLDAWLGENIHVERGTRLLTKFMIEANRGVDIDVPPLLPICPSTAT